MLVVTAWPLLTSDLISLKRSPLIIFYFKISNFNLKLNNFVLDKFKFNCIILKYFSLLQSLQISIYVRHIPNCEVGATLPGKEREIRCPFRRGPADPTTKGAACRQGLPCPPQKHPSLQLAPLTRHTITSSILSRASNEWGRIVCSSHKNR